MLIFFCSHNYVQIHSFEWHQTYIMTTRPGFEPNYFTYWRKNDTEKISMPPPLRKVDTQIREAFQIFRSWKNSSLSPLKDEQIKWLFDHFNWIIKGVSADADPHYQKLYGRVTDVCSNRRGQPNQSAMKEPRPGRYPSMIRYAPPSGKYAFLGERWWLHSNTFDKTCGASSKCDY